MDAERKAIIQGYLRQARALRDTMVEIYRTNESDIGRLSSYQFFMGKYNALRLEVTPHVKLGGLLDFFDEDKKKEPFQTHPRTQKYYFESVWANLNILITALINELDIQDHEVLSLRDFFRANLRRAVFTVPEKEKEIQDTVEQLMIGKGLSKGLDYDRESGRVKVSAKEVVPDFILIKLNLALEVKLLKDNSRRSELIDEINADIRTYSKEYHYLLFLIYDLGVIRDEAEFKRDLENTTNIFVEVVKH